MKAVEIFPAFGIDNLRIADRPEPEPGPNEVKIRVRAVSLNFRDLKTVEGVNYPSIELPRIPCSDGAGEIAAVGSGVTDLKVGDRVMGLFMPTWQRGSVTPADAVAAQGGFVDGMAAQYVVLPANGVVKTPDYLNDEEAATLPCAALTAWAALFENRRLAANRTVLVRGTGGVSMFAFQIAKALGCRVFATSSSPDKIAKLQELGADGVCNYREENWVEWAQAQTDGAGVDVIVDSVGGEALNESTEAAKMGGYIALMGVQEGIEGNIKTVNILRKNLQLQGIFVGSREMQLRMNEYFEKYQIRPLISDRYSLNDVQDAFRCMSERRHFGKIVVSLD